MGTLEDGRGGECPARSARSLVLDGGDGVALSPVDGDGHGNALELLFGFLNGPEVSGLPFSRLVSEHALVLLFGPVGEFVVSDLEVFSIVSLGVRLDVLVGSVPPAHACLELVHGGV